VDAVHDPPRQSATVSPAGIELNVEIAADQDALGVLGESPSFESIPRLEQK